MGVARSARGSDRLPPSARICSGPRSGGRHVTHAAAPNAGVGDSTNTRRSIAHVNSKSRLASKASLNTGKPPLRKLAPDLAGSRDFQKGMRPPTSLAATHPAAYDGANDGDVIKSHVHSSPLKPPHVKMCGTTPSPGLGLLPSTPLFPTPLIKKEPGLEKSPSSHRPLTGPHAAVKKSNAYICSIPADPMHQTSMSPPDWHGKAGLLCTDMTPDNCGMVSPICMTGLPFGGMIEMATSYGPSSPHRATKREQ